MSLTYSQIKEREQNFRKFLIILYRVTIVFYFFSFLFFLSIGWYCGAGVFRLIGCTPLSLSRALRTFFNNKNNNNNNNNNALQQNCLELLCHHFLRFQKFKLKLISEKFLLPLISRNELSITMVLLTTLPWTEVENTT